MIQTLHILNGQSMYNYFKRTNFLGDEMMIPFNEAMCFGEIKGEIFSQEFIITRAKVHQVSKEEYMDISINPLQPLVNGDFSTIELWFDEDMFCQINVLTILAWLDKTGHKKPVKLHLTGDKFESIEEYTLYAAGFYELYNQVMIYKKIPTSIHPIHLAKGIERYITYLNDESDLIQYIKKDQNIPENELVTALIKNFGEYGLGDTQYLKIIRTVRKLDS
ncbi:AraC family transcriptional regulator [Neobacillus vireti]|uniref:AraC family transcriptional regulator n=1 Tax=Neobacillus vireti TaxID=220686 RepID=UPI002FFE1E92